MKLKQFYLIVLFFAAIIAVNLLIPVETPISFIITLSLLYPVFSIMLSLYKRKTGSQVIKDYYGIVFLLTMFLMIVLGSINYFIVSYVWPHSYMELGITNLYWIVSMISFFVGYILVIKNHKKIYVPSELFYFNYPFLTITCFIIGTLGTIFSIYRIGFIPLFAGGLQGNIRYSAEMGFFAKLWQLNVIAGIGSFYLILRKNKNRTLYFIIFALSLSQTFLFNTRFHGFLIIISSLYLFWHLKNINFKRIVILIFIVFLLLILNGVFVDIRKGELNPVESAQDLSFFQSRVIYRIFGEYGDLNYLIHTYDNYLYGLTLLNIPIGFLPKEIWAIFGIDKDKILSYNSASILAEMRGAQLGLRSGIAGEFYMNFGFWGSLFMIFIGIISAYASNILLSLKKVGYDDIRVIFLILFQTIILYSLIGQINVIITSFVNYFYLMIIVMIFARKERLRCA